MRRRTAVLLAALVVGGGVAAYVVPKLLSHPHGTDTGVTACQQIQAHPYDNTLDFPTVAQLFRDSGYADLRSSGGAFIAVGLHLLATPHNPNDLADVMTTLGLVVAAYDPMAAACRAHGVNLPTSASLFASQSPGP
jgi:hypothetical protein